MLFLPPGGRWEPIYSGAQREHVCDHLRPGTSYRLRVSCASKGGESQVSSRRGKVLLETISVHVQPNALCLCSAMTCVPGRPLMSPLSQRRPFPLGPVLPQPWWAKPSPRKSLCSGVSTRVGVKHCSDFSCPDQKSLEEKKKS